MFDKILSKAKGHEDKERGENEIVDEILTKHIEQPITEHTPKYHYTKRKFFELRNMIIASLKNYPKTTDEIRKEMNVSFTTAKKHLEYLQDLGIVRKGSFRLRNGEKDLWVLNR